MRPTPPPPTLFPYTTLFRSNRARTVGSLNAASAKRPMNLLKSTGTIGGLTMVPVDLRRFMGRLAEARSEEHTSELQSRPHLVCRLLLEKKKRKTDAGQEQPH